MKTKDIELHLKKTESRFFKQGAKKKHSTAQWLGITGIIILGLMSSAVSADWIQIYSHKIIGSPPACELSDNTTTLGMPNFSADTMKSLDYRLTKELVFEDTDGELNHDECSYTVTVSSNSPLVSEIVLPYSELPVTTPSSIVSRQMTIHYIPEKIHAIPVFSSEDVTIEVRVTGSSKGSNTEAVN